MPCIVRVFLWRWSVPVWDLKFEFLATFLFCENWLSCRRRRTGESILGAPWIQMRNLHCHWKLNVVGIKYCVSWSCNHQTILSKIFSNFFDKNKSKCLEIFPISLYLIFLLSYPAILQGYYSHESFILSISCKCIKGVTNYQFLNICRCFSC